MSQHLHSGLRLPLQLPNGSWRTENREGQWGGGGGIWLKWRELGRGGGGHLVKMERVGAGGGGHLVKMERVGAGGGASG